MLSFLKKKEGERESAGWLRPLLLLGGALIGVGLLLFGGARGEKETPTVAEPEAYRETIVDYRRELEGEIRTLCQKVSGVDQVTVAVTLEGGFETVYATEGESGKYVIVGSGSNASPLILMQTAPKITGVGVVCRGGSSSAVQRELISLLSAAYDLPANRIYITEAK